MSSPTFSPDSLAHLHEFYSQEKAYFVVPKDRPRSSITTWEIVKSPKNSCLQDISVIIQRLQDAQAKLATYYSESGFEQDINTEGVLASRHLIFSAVRIKARLLSRRPTGFLWLVDLFYRILFSAKSPYQKFNEEIERCDQYMRLFEENIGKLVLHKRHANFLKAIAVNAQNTQKIESLQSLILPEINKKILESYLPVNAPFSTPHEKNKAGTYKFDTV